MYGGFATSETYSDVKLLGHLHKFGVFRDLFEGSFKGSDNSFRRLSGCYQVVGDRVDIRGEATGFDAAENIKKELEKTGHYASIAVSSSTVKQGSRVEFELKTTLAKKP